MIVAERKPKGTLSDMERFGEEMPDGRLTEPSIGKLYNVREAISYTKELGRPLSETEMKQFEL